MATPDQQVDFLTVPLANGRTWTRLDRLTYGRVMCCLCFEFCTTDQLNPVEGGVEDVCMTCARKEAAVAEIPGSACRVALDPGWGGEIQVCTRAVGHQGYHRDDRWTAGGAA
ncbi:hypothetical protein [Streptomyces violaceus]|uniref:Uncharacterized protein n=1 Tax=Streptomyces violaceus TaxID=1936 RepID=A0ABY9UMP0_STRVL|nr:hypothetical protein [Streptomyces janthinus]WND24153.1 hypothetical protein RI060_43310 [Streptomyces janthinus]GGS96832.1 hypothetical protein GCM10010270_81000 [Streptomyces janthinus]